MPKVPIKAFTVRVYGYLIDSSKQNLLCVRENVGPISALKFPGGGVEFGEGIDDALKREFFEETGLHIEPRKLVSCNRTFVQSMVEPEKQVIVLHFIVGCATALSKRQSILSPDSSLNFEWHEIDERLYDKLSFQTDKTAYQEFTKLAPEERT